MLFARKAGYSIGGLPMIRVSRGARGATCSLAGACDNINSPAEYPIPSTISTPLKPHVFSLTT
jgi:hypothetical protein